ncbi:MAG: aspartate dehydrogenase [Alphaproteobacteria bacterium]
MNKKIGIAGLGAIGSAVARALAAGIPGYDWVAASEPHPRGDFNIEYVDFEELAKRCDLIVECLPARLVPALTREVFMCGKDMIVISSAALILYPEILATHRQSKSRIIVPSGALVGIDGVNALAQTGIKSAIIRSTKPPKGLAAAPYIAEKDIDLSSLKEKTRIFAGNTLEAARGFPANVNVAATLSLAGIGPERTMVEVWADPAATTNSHEIEVTSEFSVLRARIENKPDPANPKSSMLAAQSIISILRGMNAPLVVL